MKQTKRKTKTDRESSSNRIRFEFASPTAQSVAIAGTFNDWRPNATPMIALGQGRWIKDLTLPPGTYEYCMVVDGCNWAHDPRVPETAPNPFGGLNSVLRIAASA